MTEQKKSGIRAIPYRIWLVLALILWITLLIGYHNTRAVRRERLRMDVSWDTCEVVLHEREEGRDPGWYMHLENLVGFETQSDDWNVFSGGIAAEPMLASLADRFSSLPLMDKIMAVQNGTVLFRDETPVTVSGITNFTLAVYDAENQALYYIEYNS